jgi:hypothetical protein
VLWRILELKERLVTGCEPTPFLSTNWENSWGHDSFAETTVNQRGAESRVLRPPEICYRFSLYGNPESHASFSAKSEAKGEGRLRGVERGELSRDTYSNLMTRPGTGSTGIGPQALGFCIPSETVLPPGHTVPHPKPSHLLDNGVVYDACQAGSEQHLVDYASVPGYVRCGTQGDAATFDDGQEFCGPLDHGAWTGVGGDYEAGFCAVGEGEDAVVGWDAFLDFEPAANPPLTTKPTVAYDNVVAMPGAKECVGRTHHMTDAAASSSTHVPNVIQCPNKLAIPSGKRSGQMLQCTWPGCPATTPLFRRPFELIRHTDTVHLPATISCRVPGCSRQNKPFARKDKLRDHLRVGHKLGEKELAQYLPIAAAGPRVG